MAKLTCDSVKHTDQNNWNEDIIHEHVDSEELTICEQSLAACEQEFDL